jgi:hypothetical protein
MVTSPKLKKSFDKVLDFEKVSDDFGHIAPLFSPSISRIRRASRIVTVIAG